MKYNRRDFLTYSGLAAAGFAFPCPFPGQSRKTQIGLVRSTYHGLQQPSSLDDPLDYPRVRAMVWKAIEYGKPRAGSLEAKIRPGSWVVLKPNVGFLSAQSDYTSGDCTDFRVTQAVLEYVASKTRASRITIAEGGSYRGLHDAATLMAVTQDGRRANLETYDWGATEFPGWGGTVGDMLRRFSTRFPDKKFDFIDLNYDAIRDASGAYQYVEVPNIAPGVGAFAARTEYCVTHTIRNCDFLIDIPVIKVHTDCGVTLCLKNYVGTAPREVYAPSYRFSNRLLHDHYSVEGRVDGFVADLAAFHPPDFSVVDGIRGLQYANHNNRKPDQMIRSNLVMAGEDPVALDALAATMIGFNPWDLDYLHMASKKGMGTMDMDSVEVGGDEPGRIESRWGKPRAWHGRGNREWLVSRDPAGPLAAWKHYNAPTDTLNFAKVAGEAAPDTPCSAAVRIRTNGHVKAFLWVGVHGRVEAMLNGEKVLEKENLADYHVGEFQAPVELRPGQNLLTFRAQSATGSPQISALLVGERNDGDTARYIRWSA